MDVLYHIFGHISWGYSLRPYIPYIGLIYGSSSNLGSWNGHWNENNGLYDICFSSILLPVSSSPDMSWPLWTYLMYNSFNLSTCQLTTSKAKLNTIPYSEGIFIKTSSPFLETALAFFAATLKEEHVGEKRSPTWQKGYIWLQSPTSNFICWLSANGASIEMLAYLQSLSWFWPYRVLQCHVW